MQIDAVLTPLNAARAVFRETVLVAHRETLIRGVMVWALPGGGKRTSAELRELDADGFQVIAEPSPAAIAAMVLELKTEV